MKRVALACLVAAALTLLFRLLSSDDEPGRGEVVPRDRTPRAEAAPRPRPVPPLTPTVAPIATLAIAPAGSPTPRSVVRGEVEGKGRFLFRVVQEAAPRARFEVQAEGPGRFQFEAPPGDYTFEAVPLDDPWLAVSPSTGWVTAQIDHEDPSWDDISLALYRQGRLVGQVTGHTGPLAGARVVFDTGFEDGRIVVTTDRDGRYELVAVGVGRLDVSSSGDDHHDVRGVVTIWPGRERRRDVRLDAIAELAVTVHAPGGAPLWHASVEAQVVGQQHLETDRTGDDGCTTLEDLVPGEAHVIVRSEGDDLAERAVVRLEPGSNSLEVTLRDARLVDVPPRKPWLPEPEPARSAAPGPALARIAGEVREASGALIVGATVVIEWLAGETIETGTLTGASGRFDIDELPDGVYRLTIWRPDERSMAHSGFRDEPRQVDPVVGPLRVEVQGQRDVELELVAPDW